MKNKIKIDNLDIISFLNGMVFFSPVALLVRTTAGITVGQFFVLQAILSLTIFLLEIPTGKLSSPSPPSSHPDPATASREP